MKLTKHQLRNLIKEALAFEDVSGLAHEVGLYEAVGNLHQALIEKVGHEEAERWLRELVQDAVDSQVEDHESSF